jgi:hypothetical protein
MSRMLVVVIALPLVSAYSLNRLQPKPSPISGFAVIPVPIDRLVAPGQHTTMHVYDKSSLEVFQHAQAYSNSTYGQVVLDDSAMRERRFAVMPIGSRIKILSVRPSTHVDKFGGSSASLMAEVIGIGLLEPGEVVQKMPFMTVQCKDDDGLLLTSEDGCSLLNVEGDAALAALEQSALLCQSLDGVASFKGPLTQASEREAAATPFASTGGGGGDDGAAAVAATSAWSLSDCVGRVLRLRGCLAPADDSRRTLAALAATAHLPGEKRFEAMKLTTLGKGSGPVVEYVTAELAFEAKRRLALKAIGGAFEGAEGTGSSE